MAVKSLAGALLTYDVRLELCLLIAARAPCVDRIAEVMGLERDDVWARLDGRLPLHLTDISDICFALDVRPEVSLERRH